MESKLAPIVLFVYNRPWHTARTLQALMQNELAAQSHLFIYSDDAKEGASAVQLKSINEVRQIIRSKNWCKQVTIIEAFKNKGLADSIVEGVTNIVNEFGKLIVLEDDIVVSKGFLKYMNDALNLYENKSDVMGVSAFMFPIKDGGLPDTFFYNANSCWGWGTWRRAWSNYNNNPLDLYTKLIDKKVDWQKFNAYQGNEFKEQLLANIEKTLNTWAVKWHSSIYLNDGKVLHPKKSLIKNIGMDGSGENCGLTDQFKNMDTIDFIQVEKHDRLNEDEIVKDELKEYFLNCSTTNVPQHPVKNSLLKKMLLKIASKL